MTTRIHDPQAVLDYRFDWTSWLEPDEQITSAILAATGVTLGSHQVAATTVTAWVSGGTHGTLATITCHIVTNQGREEDRTIRLLIRHR